jgi:flagellum-specific ATP synthase
MTNLAFDLYDEVLRSAESLTFGGSVTDMVGLLVESKGPRAKMGEMCLLVPQNGTPVMGEAVGFRDGRVLLMPYGDLDGIAPGLRSRRPGKNCGCALAGTCWGAL